MTKEQRKKIEIKESRNKLVIKDNDLIRHTRDKLTLSEQKILIYVISKIASQDKDFKHVEFNLHEFCEIAGIKKGGTEYHHIKKSIQNLSDKSWWIENDDEEQLFRWIDTAKIINNKRIVDIVLSESLKPYLLDIKGNFTKYELINVLVLHSKYSIKIYELLKSYLWLHEWEVNIDNFKDKLGVKDKYKDYTEFKRNVLNPCIKEINKYTDLNIEFETLKFGNKVYKLYFKIEEKLGYQMTIDLLLNQEDRLRIKE